VEDGSLSAHNCTFDRNQASKGGAIYATGSVGSDISINTCVFRGNSAEEGGAIATYNGSVPGIVFSTFYANEGTAGASGIAAGPGAGVHLEQSIVAFGLGGRAIDCPSGNVTLSCSDLFGNAGGDWADCLAGELGNKGNIAADPRFCHPEVGELSIANNSPCAATQSACGLIGAVGTECQVAAVEPATWGAIKAAFGEHGRYPADGVMKTH
jgi:predicted outer membrane repeat protein